MSIGLCKNGGLRPKNFQKVMRLWEFTEEKGFEINTYYDVRGFKKKEELRRI